ncbi:hypothetical protein [Mesorhizobium onobrychidis]|nr:hypothetical protein [Mesorhizobium onobrychidis]
MLEIIQLRPFRRFRDPNEVASVSNPVSDKLVKDLPNPRINSR